MATSRHVGDSLISEEWINGKQNNDAIEEDLRSYIYPNGVSQKESQGKVGNLSASLRDAFYRVLTIEKFEDFATKRMPNMEPNVPKNFKTHAYDSAENIHDNMHGCNVDRLFAIWQVLHDDTWFVDNDVRNKDEGNFFLEANHDDRSTDFLRPFHNENGDYFTSDSVRHVTALGYTYGGLEKWLYLKQDGTYDDKKHLSELRRKLLSDYGASWKAAQASHFTDDPGEANGLSLAHFTEKVDAFRPVDRIGIDDYVVDVVYEK
ncbi:hypothetical protein K4K49_007538 [Colletotrichum sp. SAR 10_70]|nr:hypothetical protein K4K49_007538 [Colletotrichum sp. SAR 10_70]KAI8162624.1 hypothetical protein KHU50_007834 [Colletotrichum sp. SAR 10_65]KAI8169286.1 hypothetical protein K4K50_001041 [Colletotrichum sp. SAR 10_71]KAI8237767.1 hypothetical protein K4K54_010365 [Colletotrichum sp. SAR 10_86]